MTCKDCFHYDVCGFHITEETDMTVNECSHGFVDKSKIVEVVRCGECKFSILGCDHYVCVHYDYCVDANDYCSLGERKESE